MSRFHCWLGFSIILLVLCLLSCRRIPLYEAESGIYLQLEQTLPALELKEGEDVRLPASVRVCFYDPESHGLAAEEFLPAKGGFINVAAGRYDMLVYSLGTEITRVDGTQERALGRAFSGDAGQMIKVSKADGSLSRNYGVIYEPDHLWVGRLSGVQVPVHSDRDPTVVVECRMEPLLESYTLEVRHIENAESIREAVVYITGQAPCKYLWDGRFPLTPSAIFFPLTVGGSNGSGSGGNGDANSDGGSSDGQQGDDRQTIRTVFNTFGRIPGVGSEVYLNVQVTAGTGARYQWIFDVSDQFDNPDNTEHRILITEPVVVPDDGSTGGLNPTVGDWQTEIIDIHL